MCSNPGTRWVFFTLICCNYYISYFTENERKRGRGFPSTFVPEISGENLEQNWKLNLCLYCNLTMKTRKPIVNTCQGLQNFLAAILDPLVMANIVCSIVPTGLLTTKKDFIKNLSTLMELGFSSIIYFLILVREKKEFVLNCDGKTTNCKNIFLITTINIFDNDDFNLQYHSQYQNCHYWEGLT